MKARRIMQNLRVEADTPSHPVYEPIVILGLRVPSQFWEKGPSPNFWGRVVVWGSGVDLVKASRNMHNLSAGTDSLFPFMSPYNFCFWGTVPKF